MALIVLGSAAVYQQEQIGALNHEISSDAVTINGVEYRRLSVPLQSVFDAKTIVFEGVNFTAISPNLGQNFSGDDNGIQRNQRDPLSTAKLE